jgi:DNA-binding CsgD family transcriptional regulator
MGAGEAAALARDAADGFRRLRFPFSKPQRSKWPASAAPRWRFYRRCGALYDVRRLEALNTVERLEAPSELTDAAFALSVREREVADLAAQGRSRLEIARELSISHKTVEKHLGAAHQSSASRHAGNSRRW